MKQERPSDLCHDFPEYRRGSSKIIASNQLKSTLQDAFRYAWALTNDESAAHDLIQEACLRVISAKRALDRPYLFTAVRSSFVDSCRRGSRQVTTNGSPVMLTNVASPTPRDIIRVADERSALFKALEQLRPEEREALFLTIGMDQSAAQAARACGKSRGTILSLTHRAKRKLRETLNPNPIEVQI